MRIAVIGSGYVGLVSAACFAEIGHDVIAVDNNNAKIELLESGGVPIHEEFLPALLTRNHRNRLQYSTSITEAVKKADVVFITVGTPPSATGEADLSYVEAAASEIAQAIDVRKIVVEKSTVPVRTCDWLRRSLVLNGADHEMFSVASNPEFLREGTAVRDFLYPDRIVIGVDDSLSSAALQAIYEPLTSGRYYKQSGVIPPPSDKAILKAKIIVTNAKSAEFIKHASNAFLAMKISFANAVANVAECVGADISQVCAGVGSDSRIGPRFLNAGIGYGGSCFPKDVQAFHAVANSCGYRFGLLDEVMKINLEQRRYFLDKIRGALWTIRGKKLAVLGLAFKGETDDVRESPAIEIIKSLIAEGAQIRAFDPVATKNAKELLPSEGIFYEENPYSAATGSDALLILTEWREFASLDLRKLRHLLKYPIVIDGRNLYDPCEVAKAGLIYYSVGRAVAAPTGTAHELADIGDRKPKNSSLAHSFVSA